MDVKDLTSLLEASSRHHFFDSLGARVSDHGMENIPDAECSETEAAAIFAQARAGGPATPEQTVKFIWFLMLSWEGSTRRRAGPKNSIWARSETITRAC